jgi:hypothetical protein
MTSGTATTAAPKRNARRRRCECPRRCKYCGARLHRDPMGHLCPTRNCQWQHGVPGCVYAKAAADE